MTARKIRILIIDDSQDIRENLTLMLHLSEEFEVIGEASTGRDGFMKACQHRPHVVLMDVNLPEEDGIATSRAILSVLPQTKIVLISGEVGPGFKWKTVLPQAYGLLVKPVAVDALHDAVRDAYAQSA